MLRWGTTHLVLWMVCAGGLVATAHDLEGRIRITKVLTKKKVALPQTYDRTVSIANREDLSNAGLSFSSKGLDLPPNRWLRPSTKRKGILNPKS
jgi:hypothetical protein